MSNKVPWKTRMLICLPVTSRPLVFQQKEAVLSPCNFATILLTAFILDFYLPWTSRPREMEDPFTTPHEIVWQVAHEDKVCADIFCVKRDTSWWLISFSLVGPDMDSDAKICPKPWFGLDTDSFGNVCVCKSTTILTQMMADEFNFLWSEIPNSIACRGRCRSNSFSRPIRTTW